MDAYQTLVIILSIALAVFLLLGIISAILMITFFKKINRIANSIEKVMNNIETLSDATTKVATPLIALKALLDKLSFRK